MILLEIWHCQNTKLKFWGHALSPRTYLKKKLKFQSFVIAMKNSAHSLTPAMACAFVMMLMAQ